MDVIAFTSEFDRLEKLFTLVEVSQAFFKNWEKKKQFEDQRESWQVFSDMATFNQLL